MKRTTHLGLIALALLTACSSHGAGPARAAADKPNIVLIISDDHDYEHLGFMGNEQVRTPTLDRLAAAGTVFPIAHLPMSRCHPTLASMLSGRWPHQSGIYYNYGTRKLSPKNSLPSLLKGAGYATYVEGKYWEGDPRAMGFTHGAGKTAKTFVRKGQADLFKFVDEVAGKQPMFIWWAPLIPHTPHNPPARHTSKFKAGRIKVPPYIDPSQAEMFRKKEHKSLAMEAWLDEGVTELATKLKARGQYDNTLFVFLIDNGWCNGLVSKGSPFEKGVRTPMFFTWPGKIQAAQRVDGLVSTLDMYPTILDYAGVKVPPTAAGQSLRPAIEGKTGATRDVLFGAIYPAFVTKGDERPERDIYAIYARTKKWKYILYTQDVRADRNGNYFRIQSIVADYPSRDGGDEDLYDLEADPHELKNLAGNPRHRRLMDDLKAQAYAWWKQTGGKPFKVIASSGEQATPNKALRKRGKGKKKAA